MNKKMGMRIGESVFCIIYLLFDLIAGIIFFQHSSSFLFLLYGIMTLLLGLGDSFHLIPRVIRNIKVNSKKIEWWMSFGLIITSITMSLYYLFLYYVWKLLYNGVALSLIPILLWSFCFLRIFICLWPQNKWFSGGNIRMAFYRNIIFLFMGILEVVLFFMLGGGYGIGMGICILFSFLFYMPVALYGKINPKLGMLMMPKTIMYIIMICLGLSLL